MIRKEMKYDLHLMMYGETFYRRHTALNQFYSPEISPLIQMQLQSTINMFGPRRGSLPRPWNITLKHII